MVRAEFGASGCRVENGGPAAAARCYASASHQLTGWVGGVVRSIQSVGLLGAGSGGVAEDLHRRATVVLLHGSNLTGDRMSLGYRMYDADNHLYESSDAFTRHLPAHRRRDVYWATDERGHRQLVFDRKVYDYIPNPTFDPVAVAGAFDRSKVEPISDHPEYRDRDARLRTFDEQNVEGSLLFPTLINGLEEKIGANIPLYYDVMWAYNRWLDDDWGFDYQNRIFATPMIPFGDPGRASELLEWAVERGARAVAVAAAPASTAVGYRSPGDPMFDLFWARCADAGVLVCAHSGSNGYNRYSGDLTGHYEQRPFTDQSLDRVINYGRAVADYLVVLVWHGVFARFPSLKVISVENGSEWAVPLLKRFKRVIGRICCPRTLLRRSFGMCGSPRIGMMIWLSWWNRFRRRRWPQGLIGPITTRCVSLEISLDTSTGLVTPSSAKSCGRISAPYLLPPNPSSARDLGSVSSRGTGPEVDQPQDVHRQPRGPGPRPRQLPQVGREPRQLPRPPA